MEIYLTSTTIDPVHLIIMSKLFELTILLKCDMFLDDTCPNQFGFKKRHSTDICIYVLKEFIEFNKSQNTSVFVAF